MHYSGCYIRLFLFCLIKVCHLKQLQDDYQPLTLGRRRRVKPCPFLRRCPKIFLQAIPITGYTQSPEPSSEDVDTNTAISTWMCYWQSHRAALSIKLVKRPLQCEIHNLQLFLVSSQARYFIWQNESTDIIVFKRPPPPTDSVRSTSGPKIIFH